MSRWRCVGESSGPTGFSRLFDAALGVGGLATGGRTPDARWTADRIFGSFFSGNGRCYPNRNPFVSAAAIPQAVHPFRLREWWPTLTP